jgi:hypothetical protein
VPKAEIMLLRFKIKQTLLTSRSPVYPVQRFVKAGLLQPIEIEFESIVSQTLLERL